MTLLGHKTDGPKRGITISMPRSSYVPTCPVAYLDEYMRRTSNYRIAPHKYGTPVFLALRPRWAANSSRSEPRWHFGLTKASIGTVLTSFLRKVGITDAAYTARSFRPTGATIAYLSGVPIEHILHVGRWAPNSLKLVVDTYAHTDLRTNVPNRMFAPYVGSAASSPVNGPLASTSLPFPSIFHVPSPNSAIHDTFDDVDGLLSPDLSDASSVASDSSSDWSIT